MYYRKPYRIFDRGVNPGETLQQYIDRSICGFVVPVAQLDYFDFSYVCTPYIPSAYTFIESSFGYQTADMTRWADLSSEEKRNFFNCHFKTDKL